MPQDGAVVEFRGAGYRLRNGRALVEGLDLAVRKGETVALLGRSGSGKTTTLRLANALLVPTEGEVLVEGVPTTRWDPIRLRRRIGWVIQEVGLFPHLTVERNVGLVPSLEKWDEARTDARVAVMLDLVGLDPREFGPRFPHELSGGQRQRVGVARALAADPPILLMDEPFGALDPLTRAEVRREFRALEERLRKTVLLVTHDLREAFALGDRIGLLREGRLVALEEPDAFRRCDDPEVRAFLEAFEA